MTDPTPQQIVDELIAGMSFPDPDLPKNSVADNPKLVEALNYVIGMIQRKELHISIKVMYEENLRAPFKGPRSFDTVKTYIRYYLKLDPNTLTPLDNE